MTLGPKTGSRNNHWFLPACVVVVATSEFHTVHYAFLALKLIWQRWSLEIGLSPSALFCFSVMFFSVVWPIAGLMAIAALTQRQRWGHVILTIAVLLLFPFVTDFLIWGPFPLPLDDEGNIHTCGWSRLFPGRAVVLDTMSFDVLQFTSFKC